MTTRKNLLCAGLLAVCVLVPLASLRPVARAQSAVAKTDLPTKTDPAAIRLLSQMTAAYKALHSYSGTELAEGSGAMGMPYRLDLAYMRPGKMAATYSRTFGQGHGGTIKRRLLLDGKTLFIISSNDAPGRYARVTKPETSYSLWEDALIIRCDVKFPLIMQLLEGKDTAFDKDPKTIISLGPPSRLDGVAVDTVVLTYPNLKGNDTAMMQIGHDDHLLRLVTETTGPEPNQGAMTQTQTFSNVRANPALAASTFIFSPPAGAVAVQEDPGGSHADPAAVALLARMYAASAALKSFSCTLDSESTGVNVGSGNTYRVPQLHETIALEKPGRVAMMRKDSQGEAWAIADGTNLYVTTTESDGPLNALSARYLKLGIGPDDPNRLVWLSRFGNLPQYDENQDFVPNVVLGWQTMPADSYDWKMGKPGVVNGEPVDTVMLRRNEGTNNRYDLLVLAISRRDHLLRQVRDDSRDAREPLHSQIETYTHIEKNPTLPASLFVFTPPPGSIPVATAGELFTVAPH